MFIHPIAKVFLICLSGFLLSLSAPGYDLWFFAWFLLSPLFIIINTSSKLKEIILYSFLFGFTYNIWYLHWLFSIHPLSWLGLSNTQSLAISILALFITSLYNSTFFVLFAVSVVFFKKIAISPYDKGIPNLLLISLLWIAIFNKVSSFKFLLGFPWTLIEYSQYKNLLLIQISEYLGSTSISFLIVLFNMILANSLMWVFNIEKIGNRYIPRKPGQFESIIKSSSFILLLISLNLITGIFLYKSNQETFSNKSRSICILQGNLPIKTTRGGSIDIKLAKNTYKSLIDSNESPLFIAPEGALPTVFNLDSHAKFWLKELVLKKQSDIISGTYCKSKQMLTNCAVSYSPPLKKMMFYEKERLVPFGEFTPFSFLLPDILKKLASNVIDEGFKEGKKNKPLVTSLGKAGINICFELIFPTIIRKQSLQGANLLINLSDLSWFSNDFAKQQFLAFGVFRAIENRKSVLVATNNGISAFIEPSGKIKSQSLPNTQGVLLDWINPNDKITFYAKYGW